MGNVPHSVMISPDGKTAYVSNEAGRIATADDFKEYSNGTPVVAEYPTGSLAKGTISVVNIASGAFAVTGEIKVGHHPTGMALWGKNLLVANTYDDTISVIDTGSNKEVGKINLGLPIGVPGEMTNRPTAPVRTRSPSMPRTTSPTSRSTTPTPSQLSTSTTGGRRIPSRA